MLYDCVKIKVIVNMKVRERSMFLLFFLVWIIFNGKITAEIVWIGVAVSAFVFWFICKFMDYSIKKEKRFYKKLVSFGSYVYLLLKEIIGANMTLFHMILTEREKMEPVLVTFHTGLKTETARVILANSITLTPGTITVSIEGDELMVHCLDKSLVKGLDVSVFEQKLKQMEEEE